MHPRAYTRLKDWAGALLIFPGFLVFLVLPLVVDTHEAWFVSGIYFGWLGMQFYDAWQRHQRAPTDPSS